MGKIKNFIDYFKYLKDSIKCLKFKFNIVKDFNLKIKNYNNPLINNSSILDKFI